MLIYQVILPKVQLYLVWLYISQGVTPIDVTMGGGAVMPWLSLLFFPILFNIQS
jgi:hypothetical protein